MQTPDDPDPRFEHANLFANVAERAARYLSALPSRSVAPDPVAVEALVDWSKRPLPDAPTSAADVIAELDAHVSPATMASAGPRFFGWVHGGSLPAALAANWLAGAWDQNAFCFASSPGAVGVEDLALAWLREVLGLPATTAGSFTTGASVANLTALAAARHRVLARAGHDVERDGLFGAPTVTVAISAESHPTVRKALGLLGFGRERVVTLAVDRQGRIDAGALPALEGPLIVCSQAGNVNSGACDPFDALRAWADEREGWLHVDGAFGLWAQASPRTRSLTAGVERADSWATDGHKWLNVPYDCGIAFVRDADALRAAMAFEAAYLPPLAPAAGDRPAVSTPREPFHYGVEASRRARGVEVFAALRSLGRRGLAEMIETGCGHARRFAAGLREAGFEVLNDVVLNQVVVSFGDAARNAEVVRRVQAAGVCWCGPTHWRGRDAMRISVSGWATRTEDVDLSLASILACARESEEAGKTEKAEKAEEAESPAGTGSPGVARDAGCDAPGVAAS